MAITVLSLPSIDFRSKDNITKYSYRFEVEEGELAGTEESGELLLVIGSSAPAKGKVFEIQVTCASEDFDISLRTKTGITPPALEEIYQVSSINKVWTETGIDLFFVNTDSPQARQLYCVIKNNDIVNPTGDITVIIFMSQM